MKLHVISVFCICQMGTGGGGVVRKGGGWRGVHYMDMITMFMEGKVLPCLQSNRKQSACSLIEHESIL